MGKQHTPGPYIVFVGDGAPLPQDYFAFDESTGHITPCSSQLSSSLVCSQLQQIVPAGADFCRAAGGDGVPAEQCDP
jgi:hypothetical protein